MVVKMDIVVVVGGGCCGGGMKVWWAVEATGVRCTQSIGSRSWLVIKMDIVALGVGCYGCGLWTVIKMEIAVLGRGCCGHAMTV